MKTLVIVFIAFITINAQAQKHELNFTPEQTATLKTKVLTLQLELTDKQQNDVYKIYKQKSLEREKVKSAPKKEMTDDERYEMKITRLDSQITLQNQMNEILNEKQFDQWKELKSSKQKRKFLKSNREREHKREQR